VGEDAPVSTAGSGSRPDPGAPDDLLADLDPQQRAVATTVNGPVVVAAGAGTGKTRALTRRIAYGVATQAYDPTAVLAVTFTTRAAAEMRTRLAHLGVSGVSARTFHSAALSQVRYLWPRLYGRAFPDVLDNPDALLAELAGGAGLGASARDLGTEISWAKVSNVAPHEYRDQATQQSRRVSGASPTQVARLYSAYVDALAGADRVDLEDVLLAAVGLLTTQPAAARVVRQRYRWFSVDEFQDVSALQMRLLECWVGERDDVCVVGDPLQSIYSFAGARPQMLDEFSQRFPGAASLELTHNYRSTPQIISIAGAVAGQGAPSGQRARRLRPTRVAGPRVQLREAATAHDEADSVARAVRALVEQGTAERDIAILTRTRAQAGLLVRALAAQQVAVVAGGATAFYERPEVRQVVALLSAAARRDAHDASAADVADGSVEGADALLAPSLAATARAVMVEAGWQQERPSVARDAARWESWAAVLGVATDIEASAAAAGDRPPTLTDLVEELREQARIGVQPRGTGVTVATLHATKGQQFSAVFIVGAHDGGIPNRAALTRMAQPDAVAEEQRLLYVGLTRAADRLLVSWARRAGSDSPVRGPSRFLAGVLLDRPDFVNIQLHGEAGQA
jgi:DNA helicase-2/ATP-dependent DNA helicase PcrA